MTPATVVLRDGRGKHLVARVGPEDRRAFWPTWMVRPDGSVAGPESLGNWIRFCPSDYGLAEPPYPDPVRQLLDRLG
jgi:hypothetical protein